MIEATKEYHLTLNTTDEKTAGLANMIHNMGKWLHKGIISKEIYVHIHDILRKEVVTENFLSVIGYLDEREENGEYVIRVVEFPEKSDGTIRTFKLEDDKFYMLSHEETVFEAIEKSKESKGEF